ncbi:hypothetical protein [Corynebacterium pseudopelargi]|uniref:Uncharacterized protein n=1 Tax=Corynebacterium pseudopelargi TaxID=2080757 RepID=A0A3G6ISU3_9CORY|nr:hypothetical protein [Corynebacterium pseudopelargi]AZA08725.1 hypothetical protein CPPEL_02970 [Corynebacterium pseudopelargi]
MLIINHIKAQHHNTELADMRFAADDTGRTLIRKVGCWHLALPGRAPQPVANPRIAMQLAQAHERNHMTTTGTLMLKATRDGVPIIRKIGDRWVLAHPNTSTPHTHTNFQSALRQANRFNRKATK